MGRKVASCAWWFRASPLCRRLSWRFQVTFSFFFDAVLLCFACVETLCALELVHPSDVFYSSALQLYCVLQLSVCRLQWNGCVSAVRKVAALQYCLAILSFASHSWQIALQIAASCVAVVRNSIVFCNAVSADRIGMAAWRFHAAAAAGVILLRFAAESRESPCHGGVTVANGGWAAILSILALKIFFLKFL